jgi:hypothetical protein
MLLNDEHPGAHAADRELLVALDAHAFARHGVTEERHERLHRVGRALAMELSGGPHPAQDPQLAGFGSHSPSIDPAARGNAQRQGTRM